GEALPGQGVSGRVEGHSLLLGTAALMTERGMAVGGMRERLEQLRSAGQTVVLLSVDGVVRGLLGVADPIRSTTPEAIRLLRQDGLRLIMLSGDSRTTATTVARQLGIDEVIAEVLPARKAEE